MDEELSFYEKKLIVDVFLKKDFLELVKQYTGLIPSNGNCFCPFHDDKHHPSAKFYFAEDDDTFLFCFRDRRTYRASDLLLTFDKIRFNSELARAIKHFSIEGFKELKIKLDSKRKNMSFSDEAIIKLKDNFKSHKISCSDFLSATYNYFEELNLKATEDAEKALQKEKENKAGSNVGSK